MSSASPPRPSPAPPRPEGEEAPRLRLVTKVAIVLFALGSTALWIYAFSGAAERPHPDTLDDRTFARAAEPVCAEHVADVRALPLANEAATPDERAEVLAEATADLDVMVAELSALPLPPRAEEAEVVGEWLDDWRTYLEDRRGYAEALRSEGDVPFRVSQKGGTQITKPIDNFAEVNDMPSCKTPGDVG